MVKNETRKVMGHESGLQNMTVYADDTFVWEPDESILQKEFQRVVTCVTIMD
jgi:hypothetical protein